MNNQEFHQMLRDTTAAIHANEFELRVPNEIGGDNIYFSLPTPQQSGTVTQRAAYAVQAARIFLSNHGITEPSIF